ncbi:hypothetical protein C9F11_38200 [Streptomyces sp. YIM 121038]|uniref:hypothetical protein n=1 Tax=Streptomyces sp. YIM 121038 TaxID=2136401 RepID=UPI0011107BDE|nr:hypothetical protein [Streptomyces sp. YIM 121038]QCX81223.1 hypothetical protein C9F11_38200 [Streptomyces sp. YIM 121038]
MTGVPARSAYGEGDFVLYRDPVRFLLGARDHTRIGRVWKSWPDAVEVFDLAPGKVHRVPLEYVRPIPVEYLMRDIDEAPLGAEHPELASVAVAWLQQQARLQTPPELESGGDPR